MYSRDRALTKGNGRGLVCALVLDLEASDISLTSRADGIVQQELFLTLHSLRLSSNILGARWRKVQCSPVSLRIQNFSHRKTLEEFIEGFKIDLKNDAPFQLVSGKRDDNGSYFLLFLWSHVLLDAHGAEKIIEKLVSNLSGNLKISFPEKDKNGGPIVDQLRQGRLIKDRIFASARQPVTYFKQDRTSSKKGISYYRVVFDKEQTKQLDEKCRSLGMELFRSLVYLASTARAVANLLTKRGEVLHDFHVPVPHDMRRRKSDLKVSNELSFLFYRIQSSMLHSLQSCAFDLLKQAEELVECNFPRKSLSLFKVLQFLPSLFYNKTILKPTKGRFASFCFSDTGDSLSRFSANHGIKDAVHYPPHFDPPGFSVIFSRRHGELNAMIVYDKALCTEVEIQHFEVFLRNELTSKEH